METSNFSIKSISHEFKSPFSPLIVFLSSIGFTIGGFVVCSNKSGSDLTGDDLRSGMVGDIGGSDMLDFVRARFGGKAGGIPLFDDVTEEFGDFNGDCVVVLEHNK